MEYQDCAYVECPNCGQEITAQEVIESAYYNESDMLFGENQKIKCFECQYSLKVSLDAHIVTQMELVKGDKQ